MRTESRIETLKESESLQLLIAEVSDAATLTEVSKRAFDSDINCGNTIPDGPPGYDSVEWQTRRISNPKATYFKAVYKGLIIGGATVSPLQKAGEYSLDRIFIDPDYHRLGLGCLLMQKVENLFPDWTRWVLDTPAWNVRTRSFYLKVGYRLVKESSMLVFEKVRS